MKTRLLHKRRNWAAQARRKHNDSHMRCRSPYHRFSRVEQRWLGVKHGVMHADRKGRPIPLLRWAGLLEAGVRRRGRLYRLVRRTRTRYHDVSTLWVGINQSLTFGRRPLIFETMTFCMHEGRDCGLQDRQGRYFTEKGAIKGHNYEVMHVRSVEKSAG